MMIKLLLIKLNDILFSPQRISGDDWLPYLALYSDEV